MVAFRLEPLVCRRGVTPCVLVVAVALLVLVAAGCSGRPASYVPVCGDGVAEGDEECDGDDLRGHTCLSLGALAGTNLRCFHYCQFNGMDCQWETYCGDTEAHPPFEECDHLDLDGKTCASLGYAAGILLCTNQCAFDEQWCADTECDNRFDDDGNGLVDCDDPNCSGRFGCPVEVCADGIDNDDNGLIDCEDPACAGHAPSCNGGCWLTENAVFGLCADGQDNDCDGTTDADDPDCASAPVILLAYDINGPPLEPGDQLIYALTVFAADAPLAGVVASVSLADAFFEVKVLDDGSYDGQANVASWTLPAVEQQTARTVHLLATLDADIPAGTPLCHQATVHAGVSWFSDDPDVSGPDDPTCVQVAP